MSGTPVTRFPSGIAGPKDAINLPPFLNMPIYKLTAGTAFLGLT